MNVFLRIYDYFFRHRPLLWTILACLVALLAILCCRLRFTEDITAFLPLDKQHKDIVARYQDITQADRIMVIFDAGTTNQDNEQILSDAVDEFEAQYSKSGMRQPLTTRIDMQPYMDAIRFVYANIPYFLADEDYLRIDTLLAQPGYIASQMAANRKLLLLPLSSFVATRIQYDPLNLFEPTIAALWQFQPGASAFEMVDGYMLTRDRRMAFAYLDSPYGPSETQHNALLVDSLRQVIAATHTDIDIRLMGAPVIAVNNARQIKHDTLLTVSVALLFITILLLLSARRRKSYGFSFRHILPVLSAVAFGVLFGTAVLAVIHPDVSLIVLGIGTILIGIAINYPLHLVVHRGYTDTMRATLREELSPLVIGNITTIAAFLTLLPLQAAALRDLGIFAAAMLMGTIIFSILFLPHFPGLTHAKAAPNIPAPPTGNRSKHAPILYVTILIITVLCAIFAPRLEFDNNLSNINYMTAEQRADMAYLTTLTAETDGTHTIYKIYPDSLWDTLSADQNTALRFIPNPAKQAERINAWNTFTTSHPTLMRDVQAAAKACGFRETAFCLSPYGAPQTLTVQSSVDFFLPLTATVLQNRLRNHYFIQPVSLTDNRQYTISPNDPAQIIDIQATNRRVTAALSDNFNYIGTACSLIVFVFLWISFFGHFRHQSLLSKLTKSLWLTLIAFLPMMLSWIWILGAMHFFGLQFNIVNIILATFIFGQGDDYTIFIVEGLLHEHRTGKTILPQYRREIALSALTMLVGIGVLILAKHPAMFSLGAVTLIGMATVVVMAMALPPLLFNASIWLRNRVRR